MEFTPSQRATHHLTIEDETGVVGVLLEGRGDSLLDTSVDAGDGSLLVGHGQSLIIDLKAFVTHPGEDLPRRENAAS